MKAVKHFIWSVLMLTSILAVFTGCTAASSDTLIPSLETPYSEQRYTIDLGDNRGVKWVLNGDGETIMEEEGYTVLFDVLTGEPQCKAQYRLESLGAANENGYVETRDISALYDMDGNLLYDWSECVYQAGFGDLIIRQNRNLMFNEEILPEDFISELWNFKTGQTHLAEVGTMELMGDGQTLLLKDAMYRPLGIVDSAGNVRCGFPVPERYAYATVWNDYIIASSRPLFSQSEAAYQYYLLTPNFEPLITHDLIYGGWTGNVLEYYDNPDQPGHINVIITPDGNELLTIGLGEIFAYYDEEIAVVRSGDDSETDPWRYRLVRLADRVVLAEDYDVLSFSGSYADNNPSQRFMGYKDGCVCILDRKGKLLAQREIANVRYLDYIKEDRYRCSVLLDEANSDTILDGDLQTVVPLGIYYNVMQATDWSGNEIAYYKLLTGDGRIGEAYR